MVVEDGTGFVTNITDTGVVGFRYLTFNGSESKITLRVKGNCKGTASVYLSDENADAAAICPLELCDTSGWTEVSFDLKATAGDHPLRLVYSGEGMWELAEVTVC